MAYLALCLLDGGAVFAEQDVQSLKEAREISRRCFGEEAAARRTVVVQKADGQIIATWNREDLMAA